MLQFIDISEAWCINIGGKNGQMTEKKKWLLKVIMLIDKSIRMDIKINFYIKDIKKICLGIIKNCFLIF